ncbi:MAG TPA: hypothetical protein DCY13_13570 [Verrucomicrobiales bacterium]|nr:hypothetical protein [Verrucomicrobiales bacterium]
MTVSSLKTKAPRLIALALTLFIATTILLALRALERSEKRNHASELRSRTMQQANIVRARLEGQLNGELLLTRALVTEISGRPALTRARFDEIVSDFLTVSKHIRNIGLARGTVVEMLHPLAGNEAALGLDYSKTPDQWAAVKEAIESRQTKIAGPVQLVQGGRAIIGRTPIYVPAGAEPAKQSYYGIVSTVVDLDSLLAGSGVSDHPELQLALRGIDGLGAKGELFHGSAEVFADTPVLLDLALMDGGVWQMAAVPAGGWSEALPRLATYRAVALVVALLLVAAIVLIAIEFEQKQALELEQSRLIGELRTALEEVRTLSGLLPICSNCKMIRDDRGYWNQIEEYLHTHKNLRFTHGICPDCSHELYGDLTGPDADGEPAGLESPERRS